MTSVFADRGGPLVQGPNEQGAHTQARGSTGLLDVTFPIDIVYTWVDGSDPQWQARKDQALESAGRCPGGGAQAHRFHDNDELRYSVRSVEQFAPWVRDIYLVTDGQVPSWLRPDQTRITVVDHRDIFPADALPTFNSHSIEARLHHIEGLSEHFLYLNDDIFFGRSVTPRTFFDSNGVAKFFLSRRLTLSFQGLGEAAPHEQARRNTVELLERDFGVTASRYFRHTPIVQRRSLLYELEERYPAEFEQTWRSRFRSAEDFQINSWLHHYYGYLVGKTRPAKIRYAYFDPAQRRYREAMAQALTSRELDVICINEAAEEPLPAHRDAAVQWLQTYFPTPSSLER